jgi:hypothetical protein
VAQSRRDLTALGTQVAFVHMQSPEEADSWLARFGLSDVPRLSDPTHAIYRAFALDQGSLVKLAHPRVWARWARAALARGAGSQGANWRQLTGIFLVAGGDVVAEIRHRDSAARPDYAAFVRAALSERYNT